MTADTISVGQYLDRLNATLKVERAKIAGEVVGVQMYPGRTYLYFSLKDSKDGSTVKCFMWKRDLKISSLDLKDGVEVAVTATPNIYKPNGSLTLQVELIELIGEGALEKAYNELKKKLETEGLFAPEKKRELPAYPHRIGVITSRSGAVINDFLTNIGKFGFEILFVDSKVEGQDAIRDLLAALSVLKNKNLDVLVMMRGGGSLESFQAFNNETLVRAVANFPAPTLTGIGHDKDVPLVSFVSDKNVSTPSIVASLLNKTWGEALASVRLSEEKILSQFSVALKDNQYVIQNSEVIIENRFDTFLDTFRRAEESLLQAVFSIDAALRRTFESVVRQEKELVRGFELTVSRTKERLLQSEKTISLGNPKRQLAFGYSIVRRNGKILRSVKDVRKKDTLDISVSDGNIQTQII